MTRFTPAPDTFPLLVAYYLFLPLRFTAEFPFLALSPTPLPSWAYAEEMIGGLFMLCPLLMLAFALPFLRRRLRGGGCWGLLVCGLAWAGAAGVRRVGGRPRLAVYDRLRLVAGVGRAARAPCHRGAVDLPRSALRVRRLLIMLILLATLAVTLLGFFVPGRDDALIGVNSGLTTPYAPGSHCSDALPAAYWTIAGDSSGYRRITVPRIQHISRHV